MKPSRTTGAAAAILLAGLASTVLAQDLAAPSLLPLPPAGRAYPIRPTSALDALWYQPEPDVDALPSPSDRVPDAPWIRPDYGPAVGGGWGGDKWAGDWAGGYPGAYPGYGPACGPAGCPHHKYVYANGLLMTKEKRGGFVTSIDSGTFAPEVLFCAPEFGNLWHGGFEIGGGWCFGCTGQSALEAAYWGLFAAPHEASATGSLNSMIDFSDLNYLGSPANDLCLDAAAQRVLYDFDFHSVEVHLIGNNCCGGPLGCGRCGCCTLPHRRLGFGWMAGFRYIHFSEDWLFSSDRTHTVFDGSPDELNYQVDLDNNLFGFQMGAGLNACLTRRLQAVAVGRVGVYGNHITQYQRVYGPAGNAVLNNGPFSGEEYVIRSSDTDLAVSGQLDLGGRWAISPRWSLDFGYRVLGIAGVAIVEDNVVHRNFQNVHGTADIQTTGSLLLHGGYAGLTYCW